MTNKKSLILITLLAFAAGSHSASAIDGGTYTGFAPYTIFGIGEIYNQGTAYNASMGGVGIASINTRYLNILNPAAVTARDSLSFMSDFSITGNYKVFSQGNIKSANNILNLQNFAISFPLWKETAMMVGIRPYSSTGYSYGYYEKDPKVINNVGVTAHSYTGQGGIYQIYAAVGARFFKRLSIGAEYQHYFGNIVKSYSQSFSDEAAIGITQQYDIYLNTNSAKFGLQYQQSLSSKWKVAIGATYNMKARFSGYSDYTKTAGSITMDSYSDTLSRGGNSLFIAGQYGIGLSINYMDKIRAEIDYTRSDWSGCGYSSKAGFSVNNKTSSMFSESVSQMIRFGVEYLPNLSDIRYYHKKIAYRAGAYYGTENYIVNGSTITSYGITVGATLPVFRWSNGITFAANIGQRGTLDNNLVRERYIGFSLGFNLFDIWFLKNQYE